MVIRFADDQEILFHLPGGVYRGIVTPTENDNEFILRVPTEGNPVEREDGKNRLEIRCVK